MPVLPLTSVFDELPDPRRETANKLHALTDILAVATCAVIGGAEAWAAIGESRRAKKNTATGCLTVVSAWATENRLTLGQVAVPDGSNEIGVIPELLGTLDLAGAIVTIDAAGCQVESAQLIRDRGGHYLLAVKD